LPRAPPSATPAPSATIRAWDDAREERGRSSNHDQAPAEAERRAVGDIEEQRRGLERDDDLLRREVESEGETRCGSHHERPVGEALQLQSGEATHETSVAAAAIVLEAAFPVEMEPVAAIVAAS